MAEDNQAMTLAQLRDALSHRCEMAGGRSAWGHRHGIQPSVVTETISGKRDPSERVINAMGFVRVERFVPIKRGSNV